MASPKATPAKTSAPWGPGSSNAAEGKASTTAPAVTAEAQPKPEVTAGTPAVTAADTPAEGKAPEAQKTPASELHVTVTVPHAYNLSVSHGHTFHYLAGVQEMPIEHAEHWYSKAHGVEIYQPKKPA